MPGSHHWPEDLAKLKLLMLLTNKTNTQVSESLVRQMVVSISWL